MNGNRFDWFWARVTRVAAFFGGMAIMAYETGFDKADRPWLYAAAIGMMGLPVARAAETILGKLGPSERAPQDTPAHPRGRSTGGRRSGSQSRR